MKISWSAEALYERVQRAVRVTLVVEVLYIIYTTHVKPSYISHIYLVDLGLAIEARTLTTRKKIENASDMLKICGQAYGRLQRAGHQAGLKLSIAKIRHMLLIMIFMWSLRSLERQQA